MFKLIIRFDDDEARSNRTNQENSRAALERYLFYCNRFSRNNDNPVVQLP